MPVRRVLALVTAAGAAAALLTGLLATASSGSGPQVTSLPSSVRTVLDARDFALVEAALPPAAVPVTDAVSAAVAQSTSRDVAGVYAGLLTDRNWHVGDPSTPLVVENRPVYAVHMDDALVPIRSPRASERWVTLDQVVFVDALSGQVLLTTVL